MLLIYGVAAIVVGTVLNSAATFLAGGETSSAPFRRFLGGQTVNVVAVSLMGVGGLTSLIFVADYQTQPALPLQTIVAAGLIAAGTLGIRLMRRRSGTAPRAQSPADGEPIDGLVAADPEKTAPTTNQGKRAA